MAKLAKSGKTGDKKDSKEVVAETPATDASSGKKDKKKDKTAEPVTTPATDASSGKKDKKKNSKEVVVETPATDASSGKKDKKKDKTVEPETTPTVEPVGEKPSKKSKRGSVVDTNDEEVTDTSNAQAPTIPSVHETEVFDLPVEFEPLKDEYTKIGKHVDALISAKDKTDSQQFTELRQYFMAFKSVTSVANDYAHKITQKLMELQARNLEKVGGTNDVDGIAPPKKKSSKSTKH